MSVSAYSNAIIGIELDKTVLYTEKQTPSCEHDIPPNANYCPTCGVSTTPLTEDVPKPWFSYDTGNDGGFIKGPSGIEWGVLVYSIHDGPNPIKRYFPGLWVRTSNWEKTVLARKIDEEQLQAFVADMNALGIKVKREELQLISICEMSY